MSPIEVATEDMMRKNEEFDEVLRTNKDGKVDVKMFPAAQFSSKA